MDEVSIIRRLHEHRAWASQRVRAAAAHLTDEQLHRSFPIGQGSVWKTLTHLLAADFVWLEALLGNETPLLRGDDPNSLPGNQVGEDAIGSLDELIALWEELDDRWNGFLSERTGESLNRLIYKVSTSSGAGRRYATREADVLIHVCTHAQYTTAQLVNMLRHLGVEQLPDVMMISLARKEADRRDD